MGVFRVIRLDGFFFYQVGAALRPLTKLSGESTRGDMVLAAYGAQPWLAALLGQQLVRFKTCRPKGDQLAKKLASIIEEFNTNTSTDVDSKVDYLAALEVSSLAKDFETLLAGELQVVDFYAVTPKGGFDTTILAEDGLRIFPLDLAPKIPETVYDAMQAARCLAFDLPTAAAFHLHRVNEAVLRRYYDVVTDGAEHPANHGIRAYVDSMNNLKVGDKRVLSSLSDLRRFHRNPVLHPESRLTDIEEAIALLGVVTSVITFMLMAIPHSELELEPTSAG